MDPQIGRFISPWPLSICFAIACRLRRRTIFDACLNWDPTVAGVGTNRYAYSFNDPVNKSDANGHSAWKEKWDDWVDSLKGAGSGDTASGSGDSDSFSKNSVSSDSKADSLSNLARKLLNPELNLSSEERERRQKLLRKQRTEDIDTLTDFMPGISTVKGIIEFGGNPSIIGAIGIIPGGKSVKHGSKYLKSIKDQGLDLKKLNNNKNTVKVTSPNKITLYDLDGAPHKGVPTPHVQVEKMNIDPSSGKTFFNKDRSRSGVRAMHQSDIRTIRKVLNNRNKN